MQNMTMKQKVQQGFTLIELMIVVAIIGILASIAIPAYQTYIAKAKFSEVVLATSSVKVAMELCGQFEGDLKNCVATKNPGVKLALSGAVEGANVSTIKISGAASGKATILAKAISTGGLSSKTYKLKGAYTKGAVTWIKDGNCLAAGLC